MEVHQACKPLDNYSYCTHWLWNRYKPKESHYDQIVTMCMVVLVILGTDLYQLTLLLDIHALAHSRNNTSEFSASTVDTTNVWCSRSIRIRLSCLEKHKKKGMLFNSIHQIEKLNHTKNTKKLLSFTGNYLSFSFS